MKRGVWIAACILGVVLAGGGAVLMAYAMLTDPEGGLSDASVRDVGAPVMLILFAGACGAAIFMTPREVEEATKLEVDEEPAQWIKDMRRQNDPDENR